VRRSIGVSGTSRCPIELSADERVQLERRAREVSAPRRDVPCARPPLVVVGHVRYTELELELWGATAVRQIIRTSVCPEVMLAAGSRRGAYGVESDALAAGERVQRHRIEGGLMSR